MERQELNKKYRDIYVTQGNVVRISTTVPVEIDEPKKRENIYTEETKREIRKQNRNYRKTYRDNEKAFTMSVPYVIFLTVAVIAVVLMCVEYLALNSAISDVKENISLLEDNIDTLTAQNDAMDYEINGYVDVANVVQVAVEELGMVPATKDQVFFYESSDTEYMKQFGDIPQYNK